MLKLAAEHAGAMLRSQFACDVIYELARGGDSSLLALHYPTLLSALHSGIAAEAAAPRPPAAAAANGAAAGGDGAGKKDKSKKGKEKSGKVQKAQEGGEEEGAEKGGEDGEQAEKQGEQQPSHVLEDFFGSRVLRRLVADEERQAAAAAATAAVAEGAAETAKSEEAAAAAAAALEGEVEPFCAVLWREALRGRCREWGTGHSAKVVAALAHAPHKPTKDAALAEMATFLGLPEFAALKRLVESPPSHHHQQ
ncbi:hypothetical protein CLOP_g8595 [Closterium sp. NIES-67]|nr:hypothetical protein CLOP_g8595 [Closterium sp. NIES-67]